MTEMQLYGRKSLLTNKFETLNEEMTLPLEPAKCLSKAWKIFSPYDAPGDTLEAMKQLRLGENGITEHVARFKLLVSQSGLDESAAIANLCQETLPHALQ